MTDPTMPPEGAAPSDGDTSAEGDAERDSRRPLVIGAVVVGVVILAVIAWLILRDNSSNDSSIGDTTTSTTAVSTTTAPASTTAPSTTSTLPGGLSQTDAGQAVWPDPGGTVRFASPESVTKDFATKLIGFRNPILGAFQQGDSRSGEVAVTPNATGPTTTVLVRQLGSDGSWFVIGAGTDDIKVDIPGSQATVTSPLHTTGSSLAFEGTVQVKVVADGSTNPIGTGFVMGGGTQMAPFSGDITFNSPGSGHGSVIYFTDSAANGEVVSASVVRVGFGPGN